jgi:hypothetical protein
LVNTFCLEPAVWRNAARLREHLAPLHCVAIDPAAQTADIVACLADLQELVERLEAGDEGFPRLTKADDLDLVTHAARAKPKNAGLRR